MTNYERIKQMSTKEMARLLGNIFVDCNENTRIINGKIVFDILDISIRASILSLTICSIESLIFFLNSLLLGIGNITSSMRFPMQTAVPLGSLKRSPSSNVK